MQNKAEIEFIDIEENEEYINLINLVLNKCFEKEEIPELMSANKFQIEEVLGDIIISIDRVKEQAIEYGHSFEREFAYMLVHGFYHLMGYDHIEEADKLEMRKKEEEMLNSLKITR